MSNGENKIKILCLGSWVRSADTSSIWSAPSFSRCSPLNPLNPLLFLCFWLLVSRCFKKSDKDDSPQNTIGWNLKFWHLSGMQGRSWAPRFLNLLKAGLAGCSLLIAFHHYYSHLGGQLTTTLLSFIENRLPHLSEETSVALSPREPLCSSQWFLLSWLSRDRYNDII